MVTLISCQEQNFKLDHIKGNAFISENSMFSAHSKQPELLRFSEEANNGTFKFTGYSPQFFDCDAKMYKRKENNIWEISSSRRNYGDPKVEFIKDHRLEKILLNEDKLIIKSASGAEQIYHKLDSIKIAKNELNSLYNSTYAIEGDFLKNNNINNLIIEIKDTGAYPAEYILKDTNNNKIGHSSFLLKFDSKYPSIILYDSEKFLGFSFFGFITESKDDSLMVKVLIENQWQYFNFKKN